MRIVVTAVLVAIVTAGCAPPESELVVTVDSGQLQGAMIANWEVDSVFELESGHFPTSSVPEELAAALLSAASVNQLKLASNS